MNMVLATYTTDHIEIPEYNTLISMTTQYVPDSLQKHHSLQIYYFNYLVTSDERNKQVSIYTRQFAHTKRL